MNWGNYLLTSPAREPWSASGHMVRWHPLAQHKAPAGLSWGPTETKSGRRQTVIVPEGEISFLLVREDWAGSTGHQRAKCRAIQLINLHPKWLLVITDTCHWKLVMLYDAGKRSEVRVALMLYLRVTKYKTASCTSHSFRPFIDQPASSSWEVVDRDLLTCSWNRHTKPILNKIKWIFTDEGLR